MSTFSLKQLFIVFEAKCLQPVCLLLLFALLIANHGYSQIDSIKQFKPDTIASGQLTSAAAMLRIRAENSLKENKKNLTDKQNLALQQQKVNKLRSEAKKTEDYFKKGIDTNSINRGISNLEDLYQIATDGIITNKGEFYSSRNLTTSGLLVSEISKKLETLNKTLTSYRSEVSKKRKIIDSLSVDSALYYLPKDTTKLNSFIQSFAEAIKDIVPSDSMLNAADRSLASLDKRIVKLKRDLSFAVYKIEENREDLSQALFRQEIPYIFSPEVTSDRTFSNDLSSSYIKSSNVVVFFLSNNKGKFVLIALLCLLVYFLFSSVSKKVIRSKKLYALHDKDEIVKYPLLSTLFVVFTFGQFLFTYPPFASQAIMWLALSAILMLFHKEDPGIFSGKKWLILYILFVLTIAENFVLEPAHFERWLMFFLSMLSCIMIILFWREKKQAILQNKLFKPTLSLFLLLEGGSFLAIIFGRYNLSKALLTSGYFALISGIILFWTYQLLISALDTYIVATSEVGGRQNLFAKLKSVHNKTPRWFGGLFVVAWIIACVRNLYIYSVAISTINDWLFAEHTIGKYSFTLESILTFVLILFLSGLASNIVSFLADNSTTNAPLSGKKKGGLSNWLLLIRLSLIVIGVLLAFAAAGIPMDRLTIIIGSLGVGIGFGLQSIVNNLISGVILAFERPVEIGDQIELGGKIGRIKQIGIRSSRMINLDGAEVIIPNGDLLSQHVINWTLTNDQRRVEIIVGVKYGTDLYAAKDILEKILKVNKKINHQPLPAVLLNQFNNSSIDFRLLFWTDINLWIDVKSEVILSIDQSFKEAGIEIPYPQQDIYIKELPDRNKDRDKEE